MGMDPLTIGLGASAIGGLLSARSQNKANQQNYNAQNVAAQHQYAQQGMIDQYGSGMMQQGPNPFSQLLMGMMGGGPGGFQAPSQLQSYTYNPAMAGLPPQIQAMMMNPAQLDMSGVPLVGASGANAQQINPYSLPQVRAAQVNAPMINLGAVGSQGFNSGQDALSQMINRGPINTQGLIDAMQPNDQRLLDQQVAGLQGSFGSLGSRFGTAAMDKERLLRTDFANNIAQRNAQLFNTNATSNAGMQLQAAQGLQSGGLQQSGLLAQLLQANQGAGMQAGLANQQTGLQAGQMNQDAIIRTLLANQGVGTQVGLANQQAGLQAGGMNQSALMQALMADQQYAQQAGLANQGVGMQAQQQNAGNWLQTALANMGSQNQAGQFNASQMTQTGQYNAAQQQAYNQFMSQVLGQASGMQFQQQGQNSQLLSIMAGLGQVQAPQMQPSATGGAISDMGQMAMFYPMLRGLMNTSNPYANPANLPLGGIFH